MHYIISAEQPIAYAAFAGAVMAGFAFCFISVINIFRTVAHRKPGVPLFPGGLESPLNVMFRPSELAERGLAARKWCFLGLAGFFISLLVAMLIGVTAGVPV